MNKDDVLQALITKLEQVLAVIRRDPAARYVGQFEDALQMANRLLVEGYTQDELRALWSVIEQPFRPKEGGFGDYAPGHRDPATGRWIPLPGAENWRELTTELSNLAWDLRVIGRY